jgi:hypothetical protein
VTQLIERSASRLLHGFHRLQGAFRVIRNNGRGSAGLHSHQAHLVGDYVVQLACDTGSLLGHRPARFGRLFPFELYSAL